MSVPTRARILDAAWDLFLRQGFAGTTVTQIEAATALSAGSGSSYRHFRCKEEVRQAVVDREVDRINAERQIGPEPEETGGDVRVALALEFKRRLDNLRRLHPLMELVARERDHLGASVDHLGELLVARNVGIRAQRLASWMAAGVMPTRDAKALAAVVTFALTGYHLSVGFFGRPPAGVSEESLITTLVDLVAGGWRAAPPLHDAAGGVLGADCGDVAEPPSAGPGPRRRPPRSRPSRTATGGPESPLTPRSHRGRSVREHG